MKEEEVYVVASRVSADATEPAAIAPPLSISQNPVKTAKTAILSGFCSIESGGAMAAGSVLWLFCLPKIQHGRPGKLFGIRTENMNQPYL